MPEKRTSTRPASPNEDFSSSRIYRYVTGHPNVAKFAPLIVTEGVEYGNSFAAQPQTAVLLRKLGAPERECPNGCIARVFGSDSDK